LHFFGAWAVPLFLSRAGCPFLSVGSLFFSLHYPPFSGHSENPPSFNVKPPFSQHFRLFFSPFPFNGPSCPGVVRFFLPMRPSVTGTISEIPLNLPASTPNYSEQFFSLFLIPMRILFPPFLFSFQREVQGQNSF